MRVHARHNHTTHAATRRDFLKTTAAVTAALATPYRRARLRVRRRCPERADRRGFHRQRQPEHDRSAGLPGKRRRAGGGRLRREHRQPRLQNARPVPRPQAGPGEGQHVLRGQDTVGHLQRLRRLQRFPRGAGPQGHRRRGHRRPRPLARPDDGHGRARPARTSTAKSRCRSPSARARPWSRPCESTSGSSRPAATIAPARTTAAPASWCATAGSARSSGSSPWWPSRTPWTPGRAGSRCRCRRASTTTCGSAPPPKSRITRTAASTASASTWTTPAGRRRTSGPTRSTSPNGAWART